MARNSSRASGAILRAVTVFAVRVYLNAPERPPSGGLTRVFGRPVHVKHRLICPVIPGCKVLNESPFVSWAQTLEFADNSNFAGSPSGVGKSVSSSRYHS